MKSVLVVSFLLCINVELIYGSCLSYGHSCWGAHGKRSGQPPITKQGTELSRRWKTIRILPEKFKNSGIYITNEDLQNIKPDLIDDDRLNRDPLSQNMPLGYLSNSDEDNSSRDDIQIAAPESLRRKHQRINRKPYLIEDDDLSDDINSSTDETIKKLMESRNAASMRLYNLWAPNSRKSQL